MVCVLFCVCVDGRDVSRPERYQTNVLLACLTKVRCYTCEVDIQPYGEDSQIHHLIRQIHRFNISSNRKKSNHGKILLDRN